MAQGAHKITEQFEQELCRYTGAPYAVAVDNCSNALFLALYYELHVVSRCYAKFLTGNGDEIKTRITIPRHTYPSVACEIIHAGGKVGWLNDKEFDYTNEDQTIYGCIKGAYNLQPTNVWDSALSFTHNMYKTGQHMCLSFTGPYKHLKLGKGGAILTDNTEAYHWFKRARFSGRSECSYFEDDFDHERFYLPNKNEAINIPSIAGWNFYMMPEIAARGILLMQQFYNTDGSPKSNPDLWLRYPDLSKFKIFNQ